MGQDKHLETGIVFFDEVESYISNRLTKMQLADLRKSQHLTQKQVSELTGLSTQCISDIESSSVGNPTFKSILKYIDALGWEMVFQKKKQ